jgi:hypothetical protein
MRRFALPLLALLIGDACVTEPACGCSPLPLASAVITGTVTDPLGAPMAGARVALEVLRIGTCAETGSSHDLTTSDGSGRFRRVTSGLGDDVCFRLWAEPALGSSLATSDSQIVRISYGPTVAVPDSVELSFRLRPPPALRVGWAP